MPESISPAASIPPPPDSCNLDYVEAEAVAGKKKMPVTGPKGAVKTFEKAVQGFTATVNRTGSQLLAATGLKGAARIPPPDPCNMDAVEAELVEVEGFKNCPHCGEQILAIANKCKHCHEMLTKDFHVPNAELVASYAKLNNSFVKCGPGYWEVTSKYWIAIAISAVCLIVLPVGCFMLAFCITGAWINRAGWARIELQRTIRETRR